MIRPWRTRIMILIIMRKTIFLEAEFQYVSQTSLRFRGLPASASSVLGVDM